MANDTANEAGQTVAGLKRELALRTAERDEALAQLSATAEVLQVINSSPGELAPVFDAMLEKAMRLCDFTFGSLWTHEGETFYPAALRGVPAEYVDALSGQAVTPRPDAKGAFARITSGENLVLSVDVAAEPSYRLTPAGRALIEVAGARTAVAVALRKGRELFGVITAYRQQVRPFSEKQIALLQNFAAQAVIAMENARLITETREALEQQTATAEVLQVINASPGELAPVFEAMLEKALELCDASHGSLYGYDGEFAEPLAMRGDERMLAYVRERSRFRPTATMQEALEGAKVVSVLDARATEAYRLYSRYQATVDACDIRTNLIVPLLKDGVARGAIAIVRHEVRPFTDKQIALLQNFAAQAVIAMENARLITETREALEQQTATAEVLQVINSSPGDLAPVFDAMLQKALHLCAASYGGISTYDGERFQNVARRGATPEYIEFSRTYTPPPAPDSGLGRIARGEPVVHIVDIAENEAYRRRDPQRVATVELNKARTCLWVALRKDDRLLGALNIYRREVRPFDDKQIALLQNFAAQAVIAMENGRLLTETREALEQQTATAEVLGVINSSPGDLAPVFDAILEKAHSLCQAAHGHLTIYDGDLFRVVAMHGIDAVAPFLTQPFRPEPGSLQDRLLRGERLIHIPDIDIDATSPKNVRRQMAIEAGFHTVIFVPLRKDEVLVGYITAYRQEVRPFADKQIALLQNFAAQAVIAMENARLLGELRQRTDEIAAINRDLEARVAAQVTELERTGKLRRFLAPQLAELIVAQGDESILETHRREIVVVFCDLRGFTAFAERAEPEEVVGLLREYHGALGPIVARYEGTLDHYSGDGIMVFFNDPMPCPEPARRAVEMAVAMREMAEELLRRWRRHGHDIGFGVGIAQGYATLGQIGFAERMDYTAIGTVCNLAARLCAEARDGQILVSSRVAAAVEDGAGLEQVADVSLKGLSQPVLVYNVV